MESRQVLKGTLTTIILKLLQEQDRMYGYEMTRAVRERTKDRINITEAALYPALHKLCEEGKLTTETEMVDGRMRKYYSLSQQGKKESVREVEQLKEILESLNLLLKTRLSHG